MAAVAITTASYADLGEEVQSYGNWAVRRSVDAMTDQVNCLATYANNMGIQLYDDALYINVRGGPRGYQYRIDDAKATELHLVSDLMQRVGAISFEGARFEQVLRASRLRVQVITYSGAENLDLNLEGIQSAHQFIISSDECR